MPHTNRVTVVVNSYNDARFVGRAIDTALAQTHGDTEVVVVDDGSTDDSRRVIEARAAASGGRLRAVFKPNGGQGSAFNAGYAAGTGGTFVFLDADDELLPDAAAVVAATAAASREADARPVARWCWQMPVIDAGGGEVDRSGQSLGEARAAVDDARRLLEAAAAGGEIAPEAMAEAIGALPEAAVRLVPKKPPAEGDLRGHAVRCGPPVPGSSPASGCAWPRWFLRVVLPMPEGPFARGADAYLNLLAPVYGDVRRIDRPLSRYRRHGADFRATQSAFERVGRRNERLVHWRRVLHEHLSALGVDHDPAAWERDHPQRPHWESVAALERDLLAALPPGRPFVLVDQDRLNLGPDFAGRPRRHLMERDGNYGGLPADDAEALRQLEQHRRDGAESLVLFESCFWWLGHYRALAARLRQFPARLDAESAVVFDVRPAASRHAQPAARPREVAVALGGAGGRGWSP